MKYKPLIKATNIKEAMSTFEPRPLMNSELAEFYVDTDKARDEVIPRLSEIIEYLNKETPRKILFAGHRGSGKSTELVKLSDKIKDEYYIVNFSVQDELDINDISYSDLIILMMEKIAEKANMDGYIKDESLIKEIYDWFCKTKIIRTEDATKTDEGKIGAGAPGIIQQFTGLLVSLTTSMKVSYEERKEIREKVIKRISRLKEYCDRLITEIETRLPSDKKLLVIVEDLDKVEVSSLSDMFYKHSGILSEIETRIIYTVSIFLLNSSYRKLLDPKFCIVTLPMIKIKEMNGDRCDRGINKIKEIVLRRVEPGILGEDVLGTTVRETGGVLRDVFKVLDIAASAAYYRKKEVIDKKDLDYGLKRVKNDYNSSIVGDKKLGISTEDLYKKLKDIYDNKIKKLPYSDTLALLVNSQALIEYNGEQWYDIHPLVVQLMKDFG
ncbi:MAG: hypothetical protein K8T10_15380 [Candidatus Eremiobacteraeota bacterium]|nr:hypothetical protein [Candidatus Eremiobacteraeota bacterium]